MKKKHILVLSNLLIFALLETTQPATPFPSTIDAANHKDIPPATSNPTSLTIPGWGAWQPISELGKANIDAGFSNTDLGGVQEFKYACSQTTGQPMGVFPNWFRVSNLIGQIGTGQVEYGCWSDGKFLHTIAIIAVKASLEPPYCLQVTEKSPEIGIYEEPKHNTQLISRLQPGNKVEAGFPAVVREVDGENWVMILAPVEGWILQGQLESSGNLKLCERLN